LVIPPCDLDPPEEYSVGTKPKYAPMLRPVNRRQSPISTANPNAVSVDTPRRHPNRVTTAVNGLSAAIAAITLSSRSRRSTAAIIVS